MKKLLLTALVITGLTATAQVKVGSNPTVLAANANFQVEGSNGGQVVVLNNGSTGIGTANPGMKLEVRASSAHDGIRLSNANGVGWTDFVKRDGSYSSPNALSIFNYDGTAFQHGITIAQNGFVGIGTEGPAHKLEVVGGATRLGDSYFYATSGSIEMGNYITAPNNSVLDFHTTVGSDFDARIIKYVGANSDMEIANTGTGLLRFNSTQMAINGASGNVGINTLTPGLKLQVTGTGSHDGIRITNANGAGTTDFVKRDGSFGQPNAFSIYNYSGTSFKHAMTILENGNVGIGAGTENPTHGVHIGTDLRLGNNMYHGSVGAIELGQYIASDQVSLIDFHTTAGSDFDARIIKYAGANADMEIYNGGTGKMRFNASALVLDQATGYIGINGNSSPTVNFDATNSLMKIGAIRGSAGSNLHIDADTTNQMWFNYYSGTSVNVANGAGGWGNIYAAAFNVSSDRRLKQNIVKIENGLGLVSQLNPVSYDKKGSIKATNYDVHETGFIAQELQTVLPSAVSETKDADKTLSVNYIALIPVLTKAIQEQQAQIEELKAEVAKLKK